MFKSKILGKLLTGLLVVFILIQFYQPARNKSDEPAISTDFFELAEINGAMETTIKTACYDCHSNSTQYKWYDFVQPARIIVENHIKNGKKELNFSEWGGYSARKQARLLRSMKSQIEDRQMPLRSYLLLHPEARLTDEQIESLVQWLGELEEAQE